MVDAKSVRERMVARAKERQVESVDHAPAPAVTRVVVVFVEREPMRMHNRSSKHRWDLSKRDSKADKQCYRMYFRGHGRRGARKPRYKDHR